MKTFRDFVNESIKDRYILDIITGMKFEDLYNNEIEELKRNEISDKEVLKEIGKIFKYTDKDSEIILDGIMTTKFQDFWEGDLQEYMKNSEQDVYKPSLLKELKKIFKL